MVNSDLINGGLLTVFRAERLPFGVGQRKSEVTANGHGKSSVAYRPLNTVAGSRENETLAVGIADQFANSKNSEKEEYTMWKNIMKKVLGEITRLSGSSTSLNGGGCI